MLLVCSIFLAPPAAAQVTNIKLNGNLAAGMLYAGESVRLFRKVMALSDLPADIANQGG
jgi:hypothetical protein